MSDILYHYTSMSTLNSILENKNEESLTLRASDIRYLNDTKEYKLALEILRDLLIEHENSLSENKKGIDKNLPIERMDLFRNADWEIMPPFIFSLSDDGDNLPMWNTYADNSFGITIGFDKQKLEAINQGVVTSLEKCIYDDNNLKHNIKNNISNIYNSISLSGPFFGIATDYNKPIIKDFEKIVPILKDKSYSYEKEWRLIIKQNYEFDKLNFNVKNGIPKPYIEFNIDAVAIKEVVIGPCADFELIKHSLFMMLKKAGLNAGLHKEIGKIQILKSNCPFRAI